MFLNEDFIALYEELSELNEAKADTQRLIDFAGEELANRFLVIKNRLKAPENDLYYWIKNKTAAELEAAVTSLENTKSATARKRSLADEGAKLVCDTAHWKVYHITTFEASQKYGRDTQWCITGINDWGDQYWKQYTSQGVEFYFLISKQAYDPRGQLSKIAIAYYINDGDCEVFNQQDTRMALVDIPFIKEIEIPGVTLVDKHFYTCSDCGTLCSVDDYMTGADGTVYCDSCFGERFFLCDDCGAIFPNSEKHKAPRNSLLCPSCFNDAGYAYCKFCSEPIPSQYSGIKETACGEVFCDYCFWDDYLPTEAGRVDRLVLIAKFENFQDFFYELDEEQEINDIINAWRRAKKLGRITKYNNKQIEDFEKSFIEKINSLGIAIDATVFE